MAHSTKHPSRNIRTPRLQSEPALLVASVLGATPELVSLAVERMAEQFGELVFVSEPLAFSWTEYYGDELGPEPARRFLAVRELLDDPSRLCNIKRACCRLEVALGRPGGGRQVNIDPGYLNARQLVVASTKPRGHRIYLGRGVHADLMLLHSGDGYGAMPWTYPDYASPDLMAMFASLREIYLASLRLAEQRSQEP